MTQSHDEEPPALQPGTRIFVAGHRGLVGSAILRYLHEHGYENTVTRTRQELDLTDQRAVSAFFQAQCPDIVFLCAARVGGILANSTYPAQFIHENLVIQSNVIHEAWRAGVSGLLFLGSSCIYPRDCPQPIKESYLMTGPLEWTNRPYAVAKIAGIETCWAYNRQYGTHYLALMPTNLFGPGDNYDPELSHVIPGLLRRFDEAKREARPSVTVWGTGAPRREFLYSPDLAAAAVHLMSLDPEQARAAIPPEQAPLVNAGWGKDIPIRELVELVREVVGYEGEILWDTSKPDGTPRKLLDISRILATGWRPQIGLREGLRLAYEDFCDQHLQ